jgi:hypothetical protein
MRVFEGEDSGSNTHSSQSLVKASLRIQQAACGTGDGVDD